LSVEAGPNLWPVEADPGQIHQVLVNLCVNSRDAMPDGGSLTIRTVNRFLDEAYCRLHPDARPGEFVELSVSDTGHGMDEATLARIFEPFFTTKELGKGTGLGLAMVYGSIRQHGGWITVESEPGRGTTFRILLPRTPTVSLPVEEPAMAAEAVGAGTVLLVDDEEPIRRLGRAILEAAGHRVLEASDGAEAIEVFRRHQPEIQLVLLDMMMPRKGGRETLEELHRLAPDVPVVLASGFAPVSAEELQALGAASYIQKPFRLLELSRTVRRALQDKVTPGR
jgi:CheY-like chemotaxis protein